MVGVDSNGVIVGLFVGEMVFDIIDVSGIVILSVGGVVSGGGVGIYNLVFGVGCQIWGCIDLIVSNYNFLVIDDDGFCCVDNYVSVIIQLFYYVGECFWDVIDLQGNVIVLGGGYIIGLVLVGDFYLNIIFGFFCLLDDCYIIN